ncbi:MAG TPA: Ig domain-containing protein [Polyangiaceae bacterium]
MLGTPARLALLVFAATCAVAGGARAEPPTIEAILPRHYDREELVVKAGTQLELTLVAADPDGDPLLVQALGLPGGAAFDPALRRLSWSPTLAQAGSHVVVFSVSDGSKEVTRALSLTVVRNRVPVFFRRAYSLGVGQFGRVAFAADDADGDALSYRLLNPPPGATFDPAQGVLQWRPRADAVGRHRFRVGVSDGLAEVTEEFEVEVSAPSEEAWAAFLQPGGGFSGYLPSDAEAGSFWGASLRVSLFSWLHRTEAPGPGYGRLYLGAEFLLSSDDTVAPLFGYMVGFELSVERNPTRRVLIPLYGLEVGGLVHEELGYPFQATPFAGLVLFADRGVALSARGGYRWVPVRFNELSGAQVQLMLDGHLW